MRYGSLYKSADWLVALSRGDDEWREREPPNRVQLETTKVTHYQCCALSDSRALVGYYDCDVSGPVPSAERLAPSRAPPTRRRRDGDRRFAATCGGDGGETLAATSHEKDQSVRVHRLHRYQTYFSSGWLLEATRAHSAEESLAPLVARRSTARQRVLRGNAIGTQSSNSCRNSYY